jgi:hypothetical protein
MSYDPKRFRRHNNFMDRLLHDRNNQTEGHKFSFVYLHHVCFRYLTREYERYITKKYTFDSM